MMMREANNGICIPRAQSSLELLSQTAIEVESANSSPRLFLEYGSRTSSPALVTPASSISETLVLPDIGATTKKTKHNNGGAYSGSDDDDDKTTNRNPTKYYHQPLMPRPPVVDHQAMMRGEPSGLCISLLASSGAGGGTNHPNSEHPTHIFPSLSFSSSSCGGGGGSFQLTESTTVSALNHHQENTWLRQQLAVKDLTIATLQTQVQKLTQEIGQLRQLPTGKISQIPLEDMLSIMREYGSEVSDMAMPPRKSFVQKASVVRQFRRWNPHFLEWFEHINGRWVPKLGKEGELRRRKQARQDAATHRRKRTTSSNSSPKNKNHQCSSY